MKVIKSLSTEVSDFIVSIESAGMADDTSGHLTTLMRVDQYFMSSTLCAERISEQLARREKLNIPTLEAETLSFFDTILIYMKASRISSSSSVGISREGLDELQSVHDSLKEQLIVEGTRSHISVAQMSEAIDCLAEGIRLAQQWFKAYTRLQKLQLEFASSSSDASD